MAFTEVPANTNHYFTRQRKRLRILLLLDESFKSNLERFDVSNKFLIRHSIPLSRPTAVGQRNIARGFTRSIARCHPFGSLGDVVQVAQVVDGPGRDQVPQRDGVRSGTSTSGVMSGLPRAA
jgi:hypothetical protein